MSLARLKMRWTLACPFVFCTGTLLATSTMLHAQNECSTAIAITAGEPTAFSTGAATASANPPSDALCPGTALDWADSPDVWFRWIAPRDSVATISTCGTNSYDTSIAVYRGTCAAPTLIACNGDALPLVFDMNDLNVALSARANGSTRLALCGD